MEFLDELNILNLLYSYNTWWNTNIVSENFVKPTKRSPFYDAKKVFLEMDVRRTVLLSGVRRDFDPIN